MLQEKMNLDSLLKAIIPLDKYHPFPKANERKVWENLQSSSLNKARAEYLINSADELLGKPWPQLPASLFAEFVRIGNRNNYQTLYYKRRNDLAVLVLAECMQHEGRFMDEILNGLVYILEETTWALPAHSLRREGDILQREDQQCVALFSCETAAVLAEILYLLEDELTTLSPTVPIRIRQAVIDRVIAPVEENIEAFPWAYGRNNWTPWCAANILASAAIVLNDSKRLARLIDGPLNTVIDRFLKKYSPDGCCDEGPAYWNVSPGTLLMYLELLYELTNGALSIYDESLIYKMGTYVCNSHLTGCWTLNFADAAPNTKIIRGFAYRYSERINCQSMKTLVEHSMRNWQQDGKITPLLQEKRTGADINYMLRELFWIPVDYCPEPLYKEKVVWYPHTQVMIARQSENDSEGLILAAKGGHNDENHNHNDIGHFVIYSNGAPFIVDLGVAVYTAQTFSNRRYELFAMGSRDHNVPVFNGLEQSPGTDFCATDVEFAQENNICSLEMELVSAYPETAAIKSVRRKLSLMEDGIILTDSFDLTEAKKIEVNFYTPALLDIQADSLIFSNNGEQLRMSWDADVDIKTECIDLSESSMPAVWGDSINKITLSGYYSSERKGYTLHFSAI